MIRAIMVMLLIGLICRMAHLSPRAPIHVALSMARALVMVAVGLLRAAVRA